MEIQNPIFLIGSGRSGTTILYKLLCLHPQLCWFSNYTNRFPRLPILSIFHQLNDLPVLGLKLKAQNLKRRNPFRFFPKPVEGDFIYHDYCKFAHDRKTTEKDMEKDLERKFKKTIKTHLKFSSKKRFISKQTANTQRLRLLNRIFPEAYYIHLIRDGREVAHSYSKVKWWNQLDLWWLGDKPCIWEKTGKEPIELCARHWKHNVEEILSNRNLFGERYLELRYEELIKRPKESLNKIFKFSNLEPANKIMDIIPEKLEDMSYKWRQNLSHSQKTILSETVGDFLDQLGYTRQIEL